MNTFRFESDAIKSLLWKLDAVIEQVEDSKGDEEIRYSSNGISSDILTAKADKAANAVRDTHKIFVKRLKKYRSETANAKVAIEGTDADRAAKFRGLRKKDESG